MPSGVRRIAQWVTEVRRNGWMPLGVGGDPSWIYTVGLRWTFDHPELIVVHPDLAKARDLIGHAVDQIRTGTRFRPGSTWTTSCGIPTRFGTVHHGNLVGEWFARWSQVAAACGQSSAGLRALNGSYDGDHRGTGSWNMSHPSAGPTSPPSETSPTGIVGLGQLL